MLGDFNTPPGARGFDAWKSRFTLANEAQARGFLETWCYGLPALTIDQLWLSPDLEAVSAEPTQTWRSDHARMNFRVMPR
jgi:endonuclease/exonuclease/phosphatase (EEP) superfamily protein YafD